MLAASPPTPTPPILAGDLKISDQNNWGRPEQKIKLGGGGELNLRGAYADMPTSWVKIAWEGW